MNPKKPKTYYRIAYRDPADGKNVELKASKVEDSSLGLGFIAVSEFVFEEYPVVVDPTEESLKKRLENVKSLHLSVYCILSIEEVGSSNKGLQFKKDKSNLVVLASQMPSPLVKF